MEWKTLPTFTKSTDFETRTVSGIFAVHGNVDSYADRSHPGAFSKTIQERVGQIRALWNHDFWAPPIAKIESLREVTRDELPAEILAKAPDATGGVEVVRRYLKTPRADEVFEGIKEGAITEMSYAYDAMQFDFAEENGKQIRNLRQVKLYEVSDVLWGANPATQGSKADPAIGHIVSYLTALKAGARHSAADIAMLNEIAANAVALGATNAKLVTPDDEDAGKSAGHPAATPAPGLITLDDLRARLDLLALSV